MRTTSPVHPSTTPELPVQDGQRPANRAQRRAAARGRDAATGVPAGPAPRTAGPGVQVKALHTRNDFAARKSG